MSYGKKFTLFLLVLIVILGVGYFISGFWSINKNKTVDDTTKEYLSKFLLSIKTKESDVELYIENIGKNVGVVSQVVKSGENIATAKRNADLEIDKRVQNLDKLLDGLVKMTQISTDNKSNFLKTVQTESKNLKDLRIKIDSENTMVSVVEEIKMLNQSRYIYDLILPQGYIIASADKILEISKDLESLEASMVKRFEKDNTDKVVLEDLAMKSLALKTNAQTAIATVLSLTAGSNDASINSNKTAMEYAFKDVKEGSESAKLVFDGLDKIIGELSE